MARKRRRSRASKYVKEDKNDSSNNTNNSSDTSDVIRDHSINTTGSDQGHDESKMDTNNNKNTSNNSSTDNDESPSQVEQVRNDVSPSQVEQVRKTVFVTVGTTKFDKLINKVLERDFIQALNDLNYTDLIIQTGMSEYEYKKGELLKLVNSNSPQCDTTGANNPAQNNLRTQIYDYKQSIADDVEVADLVVGHAGAGTCLEVLRKKKKLLVVTNDDLMDNHQFELAQQLSEGNYLMACNLNKLKESVMKISDPKVEFSEFPQQDVDRMSRVLDNVLT